ncbi:MAG: helix-turn-helix domain-containing protein [Candidatus Komeilibacteria bacterium]|nr:helix-turn-helix domain-containing protein [Candidatus Komeilibacteria bacterium]
MSFVQKKLIGSKNLPEIIKEERTAASLNLEEVSFKTEISLKYLQALESGDYHLLPGEVYTKEFLKKLAKLFHLNEKNFYAIYQQERAIQPPLLNMEYLAAKKRSNFFSWLNPKIIRLGLAGLILLSLFGYLAWEVKNIFTPPVLTITSPLNQSVTADASVEIKGKTEPETTTLINQQEILIEPDGSFSQTVDLTLGLNVFKISSKRRHGQDNNVTISILRTPPSGAEQVNQQNTGSAYN